MAGRILIYSDEDTARARARQLRDGGWHVVLAGRQDGGYKLAENDGAAKDLAGEWAVLASEVEFPEF